MITKIKTNLDGATSHLHITVGINQVSIKETASNQNGVAVIEEWEGTTQDFYDKVLMPFFIELSHERDLEDDRQRFRDMGMNETQVKKAMDCFEDGIFCEEEIQDIVGFSS
jgi:hypothetical protein